MSICIDLEKKTYMVVRTFEYLNMFLKQVLQQLTPTQVKNVTEQLSLSQILSYV